MNTPVKEMRPGYIMMIIHQLLLADVFVAF
jgi:hypothetical protein